VISAICNFVHTASHAVQCQQQDGRHGTSHTTDSQTYNTQMYQCSGTAQKNNCTNSYQQAH